MNRMSITETFEPGDAIEGDIFLETTAEGIFLKTREFAFIKRKNGEKRMLPPFSMIGPLPEEVFSIGKPHNEKDN